MTGKEELRAAWIAAHNWTCAHDGEGRGRSTLGSIVD